MKQNSFFKLFLLAVICAFMAVSCTGPEGAMGLTGSDGTDGINGENGADGQNGADGTDGVSGNAACLVCHTQEGMDMVKAEYKLSGHGNQGRSLSYPGARSGCMECHSNEGYINHTSGYDPEENIDFASMITCGTCHGDHSSLEEGISAPMRTDAPVRSIADMDENAETVAVFDFESSSNTCANCHQARVTGLTYSEVDSVWNDEGMLDFAIHEDSVYLSSTHASPHYTTMTNNIFGHGGYTTVPGTVMNAHKGVGCVGCHMAGAEDGMENGGHTMTATLNGCIKCHTSATNFDVDGTQTEIHAAEEAIADALVETGILDAEHEAVVGIYHKDVFEAYWNYKIIHYDGSAGVHNPAYIRSMIDYAEQKLGL